MLPGLGRRVLLPLVLVAALAAALGTAPSPARSAPAAVVAPVEVQRVGLAERIEQLGVVESVTEVPRIPPRGMRFFRIRFSLPVDHDDPDGPRFRLRATLLHRGKDRPTVVTTSGYGISTWRSAYQYEVTRIVRGNQLDLEHRFFPPSRPADPDWATQLTIRQAAADQHLVLRAMKRIYDRRWLSTGHSKGGMAMTYHRHFHPDDVAGTIAYVAPNDAVDDDDNYASFQAGIGGTPYADCRADLVAVQRRILQDREWFGSRLADEGRFTVLGGPDRALEAATIELYFAFWQYQDAELACDEVPGPAAPRRRVWSWGDQVLGWSYVSDSGLRPYIPYYFQAATELGGPAPYEDELADLLRYPGHDVVQSFLPDRFEPVTFDPTAMAEVDAWVKSSATRMVFVYGFFDPWSAEGFRCESGGGQRQCFHHWVMANHGADIAQMVDFVRRQTVSRIRRWAGLSATAAAITAAERRIARAEPVRELRRAVPAR